MSYPQPDPNAYAISDYGFFRLNTSLASPGDIYESAQGAKAFAIGPDSDIANAVAVYLDEDVTNGTLMNQIAFSANRAAVGTIFARGDATYAPSGRPGRIFLYSNDVFDPDFVPQGFNVSDDAITIVQPIFDIMQYFEPPQSLGPARVDRRYYFQDYDVGEGGVQWIVLPFYGRRYASLMFQNAQASGTANVEVFGLSYAIVDDSLGTSVTELFHQETLIKSLNLNDTNTRQGQVIVSADGSGKSDAAGMFDAIMLAITNQPVVARITFSDFVGGM